MNKLLENETLFAETNKKLTAATSELSPADFPKDLILELYCECANKVCLERMGITYDEYQSAKGPLTFVVKPEHYLPEFEHLIKQTENYWIIAKRPDKLKKDFQT